MGLSLNGKDFHKALSKDGKNPNFVVAKTVSTDEADIAEMDDKTPFDFEIAF